MKNINQIMVIFLINLFYPSSYAQVYTPNGSSVDYISVSYTASELAQIEAEAANWISARGWTNDVIRISPATGDYNCHSYAWYRSEGGTGNYWVNAFLNADVSNFYPYSYNSTLPAPNNIKKYWEDGSYIEVSESEATKVWYGSCWTWNNYSGWGNSCDHSAIRITSGIHAGKYESKWGAWPRYIHPADKIHITQVIADITQKDPPSPAHLLSVPVLQPLILSIMLLPVLHGLQADFSTSLPVWVIPLHSLPTLGERPNG